MMQSEMPSASDLSYFVEVMATQNLSRAAERLGITQPSLTLAIQRLEHAVGTLLLIRSKRGVMPTQAGKQLLAHTRELLQKWEQIKGKTLASVNEVQGTFALGCHVSVSLYALSRFLPEILEQNPRLELQLHHDLSRKILERVIRLELDLGIVINPVRHPDLVIRKLGEDEVTLWAREDKTKSQYLESGDAVLICDPDLLQTQSILAKLKKSGIRFGRVMPSSSLEVVTHLVAAGAGIGIIPSRVVAAVSPIKIKRVIKAPVFKDEICLITRAESRGVRAMQILTESIVKSFVE